MLIDMVKLREKACMLTSKKKKKKMLIDMVKLRDEA